MRRWLAPAGLFVALTLALTLPLLRTLSSALPHDAGDPVLNTWILWWSTKQMPFTTAWWNAPMFFPMQGALAMSEVLLGLVPITAPVTWLTGNPVTAYNVAFVLSFPLCALGACALAFELTGRRDAAVLAGLAFAFAPYRMGHLAHIQVLSYYGAPVALFALHRFVRTHATRWLLLFGSAWLVQALSNGYALFHLAVLIAFWIVWFARPLTRAIPIVVAWVVSSLPLVPVLLTYQRIHDRLHLTRSINEIRGFGIDLADFFTPSSELAVWGGRLWPVGPETNVFPGAVMIALAAAGLGAAWRASRSRPAHRTRDQQVLIGISAVAALVAFSFLALGAWQIGPLTVSEFRKPFSVAVVARVLAWLRGEWMRRSWREHSPVAFYVLAVAGMYVLALGPEPRIAGRPFLYQPPYAWLMHLPGFETLRVPARFASLAVLSQSMLLAYAVARWPILHRRSWVAPLLGLAILVEGWVVLPVAPVAAAGPAWNGVAAVVELPIGEANDFAAISRGMALDVPIVNGYSGYFPPHYAPLLYAVKHRQYEALHELAPDRPLGVTLDVLEGGGRERDALLASGGFTLRTADNRWETLVAEPRMYKPAAIGAVVPFVSVQANRHPEDIGRLSDGDIETAWSPGETQIGDEAVTIDLQSPHAIAAVVLKMGSFAFGFPRDLIVEGSIDGAAWTLLWRGDTAVATVRAAVQDPGTVPLTIGFEPASARFLRLTQAGSEFGVPWWIAELEVRATP